MKRITAGQIILLSVMIVFAAACLLPLALVVIASFSSEASLATRGFSYFPSEWSLKGWNYVIKMKNQLLVSYRVTILITFIGTLGSLLFMSMIAFALSRRTFVLRTFISMLLLFTMLFSGGQLAGYLINTSVYHLKDTWLILCLPSVGAMNIIIMRTYIQENIADSLIESAWLDGAGDFRIYMQIVMPLMPPVLASLGFMIAVGYWNNWETGYLYISSPNKTPLQLLLMRIENNISMLKNNSNLSSAAMAAMEKEIPEESARMALLFTVLGPIMIVYPFFQKYFVKGLTVGSVKG